MGAQRRYSSGRDGSGERPPEDGEKWKGGDGRGDLQHGEKVGKIESGRNGSFNELWLKFNGKHFQWIRDWKEGLDRNRNRIDRGRYMKRNRH